MSPSLVPRLLCGEEEKSLALVLKSGGLGGGCAEGLAMQNQWEEAWELREVGRWGGAICTVTPEICTSLVPRSLQLSVVWERDC